MGEEKNVTMSKHVNSPLKGIEKKKYQKSLTKLIYDLFFLIVTLTRIKRKQNFKTIIAQFATYTAVNEASICFVNNKFVWKALQQK